MKKKRKFNNTYFFVILVLLFVSCSNENKFIMEYEIKFLDKNIKENRPHYYQKLNNGLSENEIDQLEEQYDIELPQDIKELYQWKNGQEMLCFDAFVNNSMFTPLEQVLKTNKKLSQMIGNDFEIENWWNKNWLPIFHNGGGDYICYDIDGIFNGQKGQILLFLHDSNIRTVLTYDLKTFIQKLNEYYQEHSKDNIDEYIDINDKLRGKLKFTVKTPLK